MQAGFRWQSPAELATGRRKLTRLRNEEYTMPANKTLKAKILLTPSFLSNSIPNCNSTQVCSFAFLNDYSIPKCTGFRLFLFSQ